MASSPDPDTKRVEEDVSQDVSQDLSPSDGGARDSSSLGPKDDATLPPGVLDPVYDAKARILNRAVSIRNMVIITWEFCH